MSSTPRTNEQPRRRRVIKVYVTPGEKRRIRWVAQPLNCSMSDVLYFNGVVRSGETLVPLRHRVDLRMLTIQLRTLLEKITLPERIEGAGAMSRSGIDAALAADLRALTEAAARDLQTTTGDIAERASADDVSARPTDR